MQHRKRIVLKKLRGSDMPAIMMIFFGFTAGLLTMTIINLYKHVLKRLNEGF